ncbi:hypothetical protein ACFU5O_35495 [Streptomyces sp. NPDC057445]|uniref:hypothetical protein n=1 Tax=Streptomyces sp. NPDC057445 TaxID=3346136 RepID=UPI00367F5429
MRRLVETHQVEHAVGITMSPGQARVGPRPALAGMRGARGELVRPPARRPV